MTGERAGEHRVHGAYPV